MADAASDEESGPSGELLLAATRVALPPSGISPTDLPHPDSPGATYTLKYCSACHATPSPGTHSATDWPSVVRRMWLRMDRIDPSFGVAVPTPAERLVTLRYLLDNALRVSGTTLPEGAGRELFMTTCSQCHELADPMQHSPNDWVTVVRRMQGHMEDLLRVSITPGELQRIVAYRQTVSSS